MSKSVLYSNGSLDMENNGLALDGISLILNFTKSTTNEYVTMANVSSANDDDLYYKQSYSAISMTLYTLIFISGLTGNIMVVCVISRCKSMHTATNCYLVSLAVADCLILISATLPAIPEPLFQIKEWPWGRAMCSILVFLQYLGINASTLSIAAFTIERYIAICHPMRAHVICSVNRAKRIIAVLWVCSVLYCSPWIGLTYTFKISSGGKEIEICYFRLERNQYLAYYLSDLVCLYVIPLIIAAAMYACIARTLFKTMSNRTGYLLDARRQSSVSKCGQDINRNRTNSRFQVVRMLIVIVSVFAIAWLPYRTLVVYNSLSQTQYLNCWYLLFCRSLLYTNSAINPLLYSVMSIKFRRAFKNCLCCIVDSSSLVTTHHRQSILTDNKKNKHHHGHPRQSGDSRVRHSCSRSNSSTPSFETQLLAQNSCNGVGLANFSPSKGTPI